MRAGLTPNAVQWCRCGGLRGPNLAECVAMCGGSSQISRESGVFWQTRVSTVVDGTHHQALNNFALHAPSRPKMPTCGIPPAPHRKPPRARWGRRAAPDIPRRGTGLPPVSRYGRHNCPRRIPSWRTRRPDRTTGTGDRYSSHKDSDARPGVEDRDVREMRSPPCRRATGRSRGAPAVRWARGIRDPPAAPIG